MTPPLSKQDHLNMLNPESMRYKLIELADENSFVELHRYLGVDTQCIEFGKEYSSVIVAKTKISGHKCFLCVVEPLFNEGKLGLIEFKKIQMLFAVARKKKRPVIFVSISNDAQYHERDLFPIAAYTMVEVSRYIAGKHLFVSIVYGNTNSMLCNIINKSDCILSIPNSPNREVIKHVSLLDDKSLTCLTKILEEYKFYG